MNKYPINSDSIVFEIGAYEGQWAREICARYDPYLYAFEPQKWAYDICVNKLKKYTKAKIYNFALGINSGTYKMGDYHSDGASMVKNLPGRCDQEYPLFESVEVVSIEEFLKDENIDIIDLCQLNAEGYEYLFIPHLIKTGILNRIKYFRCQFHMHPFFPGEEAILLTEIDKTHDRVKNSDGCFVEWRIK